MATVLLDRVEGASGQTGLQQSRLTRVAFVYDIDTTSAPAVLVNSVAAAGMPQIGNQHPAAPGLHVVGHDVRPTGPSQCFVLIFYETLSSAGGAAEEHLVIRDTTTLSQETTQLLPVSIGLTQLRCRWRKARASAPPRTAMTPRRSRPSPTRSRSATASSTACSGRAARRSGGSACGR
jgi:hypothetical protein